MERCCPLGQVRNSASSTSDGYGPRRLAYGLRSRKTLSRVLWETQGARKSHETDDDRNRVLYSFCSDDVIGITPHYRHILYV